MRLHPVNVLLTGIRKPFMLTKLSMRMEIADYLQPVKTRKYRLDLLMSSVMRYYAFQLSAGGLETEGMLYNEPVFQLIAQQKTETFTLINLSRT